MIQVKRKNVTRNAIISNMVESLKLDIIWYKMESDMI